MHGRTRIGTWTLSVVLAAFAALPAPGAAQTSIVVNGDFESPVVATSFGFDYFAPPGFDSWAVESGSIDIVRELWTAANGAQSVDLNGACCAPGTISQPLATNAGTAYTLSFAFAGNPDPNPVCESSPALKRIEVFWGAESLGEFTFDETGHTLADPGWRTVSVAVTATALTTTLRFTSLIEGACGPAIDNVSLVEGVPQPSRSGKGCGDRNHVHAREGDCKKPPL